MKGTVIRINRNRTRAAISTDNGISLVETHGAALQIGDEVEVDLEKLGTQELLTRQGRIDVFVTDTDRTATEAMSWVSKSQV